MQGSLYSGNSEKSEKSAKGSELSNLLKKQFSPGKNINVTHRAYEIIPRNSPYSHHFKTLLNAESFISKKEFQMAIDIYQRLLNKIPLRSSREKIEENIQDIQGFLTDYDEPFSPKVQLDITYSGPPQGMQSNAPGQAQGGLTGPLGSTPIQIQMGMPQMPQIPQMPQGGGQPSGMGGMGGMSPQMGGAPMGGAMPPFSQGQVPASIPFGFMQVQALSDQDHKQQSPTSQKPFGFFDKVKEPDEEHGKAKRPSEDIEPANNTEKLLKELTDGIFQIEKALFETSKMKVDSENEPEIPSSKEKKTTEDADQSKGSEAAQAQSKEQGDESQVGQAQSKEQGKESEAGQEQSKEQGDESQVGQAQAKEQGKESEADQAQAKEQGAESQAGKAQAKEQGEESESSQAQAKEQGEESESSQAQGTEQGAESQAGKAQAKEQGEESESSQAQAKEQGEESESSQAQGTEQGEESQAGKAQAKEQGEESQASKAQAKEQGEESESSQAQAKEQGEESESSQAQAKEQGEESESSQAQGTEQGETVTGLTDEDKEPEKELGEGILQTSGDIGSLDEIDEDQSDKGEEESKPPIQEIRGVLELKEPEQEDTPFITITYDFSKIPHQYALSKDHNILEYAYYKYKPMLVKAQRFIRKKQITKALNYYRVIRDQQIPDALRNMVDRNIQDISEYLEKYLMSRPG
ncbi:MAG: hypothetical protein OEV78_01250 [Spirochaetia bacterium]|nr:hypothetical protein [Spirochaetia bacterium]